MGLGLCRYFPRAPCPLSTKGIRSSHRKEKEFSAVPSPVRQSVLHDSDVRCFSPTAFLLFASLGTNPALISPNSQIRNMYFPFSSFHNQHPTWAPCLQGAEQLCHPQKSRLAKGREHSAEFHCLCGICFSLPGNPDTF